MINFDIEGWHGTMVCAYDCLALARTPP